MQLTLEPIVKHLSPSQLWTSIEVNVHKVMGTAAVQYLQRIWFSLIPDCQDQFKTDHDDDDQQALGSGM